mgnify:CR=1 FL=1
MLNTAHLAHWPPGLPHHLTLPQTSLFHNLEVSAARYPDKPFILFYDTRISFAQFKREAEHLAGHLQQVGGVQAGDRVLIYMQNSPQWALAFYAILRANAVAVPVNPMNRSDELRHAVQDSGARAAFVAQELLPHLLPVLDDADPCPCSAASTQSGIGIFFPHDTAARTRSIHIRAISYRPIFRYNRPNFPSVNEIRGSFASRVSTTRAHRVEPRVSASSLKS